MAPPCPAPGGAPSTASPWRPSRMAMTRRGATDTSGPVGARWLCPHWPPESAWLSPSPLGLLDPRLPGGRPALVAARRPAPEDQAVGRLAGRPRLLHPRARLGPLLHPGRCAGAHRHRVAVHRRGLPGRPPWPARGPGPGLPGRHDPGRGGPPVVAVRRASHRRGLPRPGRRTPPREWPGSAAPWLSPSPSTSAGWPAGRSPGRRHRTVRDGARTASFDHRETAAGVRNRRVRFLGPAAHPAWRRRRGRARALVASWSSPSVHCVGLGVVGAHAPDGGPSVGTVDGGRRPGRRGPRVPQVPGRPGRGAGRADGRHRRCCSPPAPPAPPAAGALARGRGLPRRAARRTRPRRRRCPVWPRPRTPHWWSG